MSWVLRWLGAALLVWMADGTTTATWAQPDNQPAAIVWRLLDYLGVDYDGAVADGGHIVSQSEYDEMVEFAHQVRDRLKALPPTSKQASLVTAAVTLQAAIARKAPPAEIAGLTKSLKDDLLSAYPVPLAPAKAPDLTRGAALYTEQCASCHGPKGAGDGPAAKGLEPPPVALADATRASARSVFGLYQVIDQGLDGTAMASFAHLPSADRWALAFYVSTLASSSVDAERGRQLWHDDPALRTKVPNLQALTQITAGDLAQSFGDDTAHDLMAYLRRYPETITSDPGPILSLAPRTACGKPQGLRSR